MFQFGGFPTYTYVFSIRSMVLHHRGFPIRKSADRSLFAAPRSLSQLVTSFIGSLCQGIHLMLLFAWTFLTFQFSFSNCLSFIKQIMISVINSSVKRFYPFAFWILFPPFGEIVIYPNWKDLDLFANLLVKSLSSYLFVSYSNYFIRFSMNIFQNNGLRCFEKASFAWWTSSSPCFRKDANLAPLYHHSVQRWWAQVDSNHRPRAYQARALTTWAMSPC